MLKDTIIWLLITGIGLCFQIVEKENRKKFLKSTIIEAIAITVIFEFITNEFTFSFLIDFMKFLNFTAKVELPFLLSNTPRVISLCIINISHHLFYDIVIFRGIMAS